MCGTPASLMTRRSSIDENLSAIGTSRPQAEIRGSEVSPRIVVSTKVGPPPHSGQSTEVNVRLLVALTLARAGVDSVAFTVSMGV